MIECTAELGECSGRWWFLLHLDHGGTFDKKNGAPYSSRGGAVKGAQRAAKAIGWKVTSTFNCGEEH